MKKPDYLFFSILFLKTSFLVAQGCSDAGACTIPTLRPSTEASSPDKKNMLSAGLTAGAADHSIFVLTPSISYARKFGSGFGIDSRLTYAMHSGNGITSSGFGDVFLNLNYYPSSKFTLTGGIKIPLTDGGKYYHEQALPMDYQSSLGTLDLILAIGYASGAWNFALGYQKPLAQNSNWFYVDSLVTLPELWGFQNTFEFMRAADILVRGSRIIELSDKMTFIPGLLAIYHLAEDEIPDNSEGYMPIAGSDGLTLNATLLANLKIKETNTLNFNIGFPLIVRDVRPDGLTRSFVAGAEYSVWF